MSDSVMENVQIQDEKIVRITDVFEQIKELNKMIVLHKSDAGNASMLSQYEYMKSNFVDELNTLLKDFQITIQAA